MPNERETDKPKISSAQENDPTHEIESANNISRFRVHMKISCLHLLRPNRRDCNPREGLSQYHFEIRIVHHIVRLNKIKIDLIDPDHRQFSQKCYAVINTSN
jgi:hypothetical protein